MFQNLIVQQQFAEADDSKSINSQSKVDDNNYGLEKFDDKVIESTGNNY
jgi:hypothetical protein